MQAVRRKSYFAWLAMLLWLQVALLVTGPQTRLGAQQTAATPPAPAPTLRPPVATPPSPTPALNQRPRRDDEGRLLVRIGLATDLEQLELPCCRYPWVLQTAHGEPISEPRQRLLIHPGGRLAERAIYRLQVTALKDELQARGVATKLSDSTGLPAEAVFDAGTDLYRVRVGRFADRAAAEQARGGLEALGVVGAWIATEGGRLENPTLRLVEGSEQRQVWGRWLSIVPGAGRELIDLDRRGRFRGRVLVFLNERGGLNLINELPLEDYLRGVVPKEMGPELYNQLEALKALAVAARTYTLRNLNGFANEGYDLCSSPRCQVYGGARVEHPTSDRAVEETAGQVVLYGEHLAETFYSSTCGGHTENVEVVFPLKRGGHLRGVPCLEEGVRTLAGNSRVGERFPDGLMGQLLPPADGPRQRQLSGRLEQLARLANLPVPHDQLATLDRSELRRFLGSVFDLALDPRWLQGRETVERLLAHPPVSWPSSDRRFVEYLLHSGLYDSPASGELSSGQVETLLYRLAHYFGVLERQPASFLTLEDGALEVRSGESFQRFELPTRLATFGTSKSGGLRAGPLALMAGDKVDLYFYRHQLVAISQAVAPSRVVLGKRRPVGSWRHFRSRTQLRELVQTRYPTFPFASFEVLERGVSGRVGKLLLVGDDGRQLTIEGLPVRWTFDLPDTRFTHRVASRRDGESGWMFSGSGWGHGVGMCQTGSFGMAMRGHSYRDILSHYYTGIQFGRLKSPPDRQTQVANSG